MAFCAVFRPMRRLLGVATALLALLAVPFAAAETPPLRRGINFEVWQTWTGREGFLAGGYDRSNFPDWSKRVDDRGLAALRRQGFDFVRLNIDPSPFFWDEAEADRLLDGVAKAVDRLLSADFRVVIDLHLVPEAPDRPQGLHWALGTGGEKAAAGFVPYLGLVRQFATRFRDLPADRVALELMNEPDQDWFSRLRIADRWPGQLASLVAAARRAAPKLPLVLTGARGGSSEGLLRLDPRPFAGDDAILWSYHTYEPMAVTHSGLPWERNAAHFLTHLPFPAAAIDAPARARLLASALDRLGREVADPTERRDLEAKIAAALDAYVASQAGPAKIAAEAASVADWAKRNGVRPDRIMVGEFGAFQDGADPAARLAVVRATREAAEAAGFAWAIYTADLTKTKSSFGILADTKTLAVEPAIGDALGLVATGR
ncbi:MAG: glycoside hydrolase family 5 protein [Hyphomicrobiales bacterium]|nr:glycoside hydrolase family 5 protein [Hyphomicrobiales bacterium]